MTFSSKTFFCFIFLILLSVNSIATEEIIPFRITESYSIKSSVNRGLSRYSIKPSKENDPVKEIMLAHYIESAEIYMKVLLKEEVTYTNFNLDRYSKYYDLDFSGNNLKIVCHNLHNYNDFLEQMHLCKVLNSDVINLIKFSLKEFCSFHNTILDKKSKNKEGDLNEEQFILLNPPILENENPKIIKNFLWIFTHQLNLYKNLPKELMKTLYKTIY